MEWDLLVGLMALLILTPTLARLIPYGQGGVSEVEDVVMAGAVFGLIGIPGGSQATESD